VPLNDPVKSTSVELAVLQMAWFEADEVMAGLGFTVMVNVCPVPIQLLAVGVTVNIPLAAVVPVLVAVKEAIELPEPLAPMPIVVLLFAQV
jgi:hypothetical protein